MFTKVPIVMRNKDTSDNHALLFQALINIAHIVSVFPSDSGKVSSVRMLNSDTLLVALPFAEFSGRLLELRKLTLDS